MCAAPLALPPWPDRSARGTCAFSCVAVWIFVTGGTSVVRVGDASEQRHLFAKEAGIDRRLTETILQITRGRGTVTGESVGYVAVDVGDLLREILDGVGPLLDLARAIHLDAGVVDQVAVRPHPSYVSEVRRRPRGESEHDFARNPAPVTQGERHVVLLEQCQYAFADPAAMPELDGDPKIRRNSTEEINQRRQFTGLEVGAHLHQHRAELFSQVADALEEGLGRAGDVAQPLLMGDLLRQLQCELKSARRPLVPAFDGRLGGRCIKRRIDLDGVEGTRVHCEKIRWSRSVRVERSDPGVVVPALGADVNGGRHDLNRTQIPAHVKILASVSESRGVRRPESTAGK